MTNLSKAADESARCIPNSNNRRQPWERPVVLTPVIWTPKSLTNKLLEEFPKKNTPKSNNLNKVKSKSSRATPSSTHVAGMLLKKESPRREQQQPCPIKKELEDLNRLRGGATIVAKLPYPKGLCIDNKKHQKTELIHGVNPEALIQTARELNSVSAPCITPRHHLLDTSNLSPSSSGQRLRWTKHNNLVGGGDKRFGYHIRVRRRNPPEDAAGSFSPNTAQNTEVLLSGPKCRCREHCNRCSRMPSPASFSRTTHTPVTNKPPTPTRVQFQPRKTSSIEDTIGRLTKRSESPVMGVTSDSPTKSSCESSRRVYRTMSTNKITEALRAKLGLPHCKLDYDDSQMSPVHTQLLSALRRQNSLDRISDSQVASTQTIPLGRCYSDSQVNAITRGSLVCCRCMHPCQKEDGTFTCEACIAVQRVKNAFVVEVFADRPAAQSTDLRLHNSTCHGIRIGVGLLPVVVMFMSLIVCSVILLSDTVMTNVCGHYCDDHSAPNAETSPRSAVWGWGWLDP